MLTILLLRMCVKAFNDVIHTNLQVCRRRKASQPRHQRSSHAEADAQAVQHDQRFKGKTLDG